MGLSKLAGKYLLLATLVISGSRMLTKPESYKDVWTEPVKFYSSYFHVQTPDVGIVVQTYGGAILLCSILILLKVEEIGEILLILLYLSSLFVYNPLSAQSEEILQASLAHLSLVVALLLLMDGVWQKIENYAEKVRAKRK